MAQPSREASRALGEQDVLLAAPPRFAIDEAAEFAGRLFGIEGSLSPLDSERDQNFRIESEHGDRLLKLSNAAETATVVDYETEALLHIRSVDPGLPITDPQPTVDGAYWASVTGDGGATHFVRMFTFLEGRHAAPGELSLESISGFGATMARLGRALRGFWHSGAGRWLLWDEKHAAHLRPLLSHIAAPHRRAVVVRAIDLFETRALPAIPSLRAQSIHNDFTLDNTLLDPDDKVSGIVDFGDLAHTTLVIDLSTAMTSLLRDRDDPFEAASALLEGYGSITPLEPRELEVLPYLLAARLCALIAIAEWRVGLFPDNEAYITDSVDDAWGLLAWLDAGGYEEAARRFAGTAPEHGVYAEVGGPAPATKDLVERRARVLGPALSRLTYRRPLHLVRGDGVWLFDTEGRAHLDAYNNVPVVGHSHPRVVEAITRQARSLNTNLRYLHETAVLLAERIVDTMPEGLDTVMFVNSGSEANDLAWRIATAATEGSGAIVTDFAYHGVTTAIADISPEEWTSGAPSHVATIPAPDGYAGPHRREEEGWVERYTADFEARVDELTERGHRPAAVFMDAGLTSDGVLTPPDEYWHALVRKTRAAGALYVADEVQTGFGRRGGMWGFEQNGIEPDLVTLGKPMGNGHPVAAVVVRSTIVERFAQTTEFFSTFGGNPVACAAGLAVLDVLADEGLPERAAATGRELLEQLGEIGRLHPAVGEVRGRGLLIGVALVRDSESRAPDPDLAERVINEMRERGVLVGRTGPHGNVLKIRPPLAFRSEHIEIVTSSLEDALQEVT